MEMSTRHLFFKFFLFVSICFPFFKKKKLKKLLSSALYGKRTVGFFCLASHALRACEVRAPRARKTHTPRFTDFFTDFEKKTDCFAVYSTGTLGSRDFSSAVSGPIVSTVKSFGPVWKVWKEHDKQCTRRI